MRLYQVIKLDSITAALDDVRTEVTTMRLCRHPNVLSLFCCFTAGDELWLVTPLMDKGSCYNVLKTLKKQACLERAAAAAAAAD